MRLPKSSPHPFPSMSEVFAHEREPAWELQLHTSTSTNLPQDLRRQNSNSNFKMLASSDMALLSFEKWYLPDCGQFLEQSPLLALGVVAVILSVQAILHLVPLAGIAGCSTVLFSISGRKAFNGIAVLSGPR